jgi:hypothetical protein
LRHYLHGDYLEPTDRRSDSVVYCAFCDGYCLPEHLYEEHELDASLVRLNASKKAFIEVSSACRALSTLRTTSRAQLIPCARQTLERSVSPA